MGTTTDTYRKKKKLKEEQERRQKNSEEQLEKITKEKRMCYDAVHKMLLDTKQTPCGPFGWGGTI